MFKRVMPQELTDSNAEDPTPPRVPKTESLKIKAYSLNVKSRRRLSMKIPVTTESGPEMCQIKR